MEHLIFELTTQVKSELIEEIYIQSFCIEMVDEDDECMRDFMYKCHF
ncbi:MAG: hypothetical protein Q8K70_10745 [Bacteroidota bacterium]|nr:hypothetical protein [Bacteroidota bacterium]